jgi:hypothetical protein
LEISLFYSKQPIFKIKIESIKVALLGGTISFRNLRYTSSNQSICVLQGHITLRFWLLVVREEKDVNNGTGFVPFEDDVEGSQGPFESRSLQEELPCRIHIRLQGLEWHMYNRTPIFDWILNELEKKSRSNDAESNESIRISTADLLSALDQDLCICGFFKMCAILI